MAELICTSRIERVVVHARGAVVTRRATPPSELPSGSIDLLIEGVTPLADSASVRAAVPGSGRQVVSVQTALDVPATAVRAGAPTQQLRDLTQRMARLQAEQERLQQRGERLATLRVAPPQHQLDGAIEARTADALAASRLLAEIQARVDDRLTGLEEELRELELLRRAAAIAEAQATARERTGGGQPSRRVTVRLDGSGAVPALEITYVVPAARWWPVYTLRLVEGEAGSRRASWWLEALVAQGSGEDWEGVALGLSTADLIHDARLPELPSLRFGRAQPPARRGYRPLPAGLDRLFAGYDRAFAPPSPAAAWPTPRTAPPEPPTDSSDLDVLEEPDAFAEESADLDEEETTSVRGVYAGSAPEVPRRSGAMLQRSKDAAFSSPPPAPPPGSAGGYGAPAPRLADKAASPRPSSIGAAFEGSDGGDGIARAPEPSGEPDDAWLDFDALVLGGGEAAPRGQLSRQVRDHAPERAATRRVEEIAPPLPVRDPQESRGLFDHRHDAEGAIDVPSDFAPHRLLLSTAEAPCAVRYRAVPREAPQVFREATLSNPFDGPLLGGPVDVYVEGTLLLTTTIERIDRGGRLEVGLGVEERIRLARNVRVSEESAGLLGGSTVIKHTITIELSSALGREVEIELRERIPVAEEKGIEVEVATPALAAEPYLQAERGAPVRGGRRFEVTLPAGGKREVTLTYRITLPSKNELIGGNRRE